MGGLPGGIWATAVTSRRKSQRLGRFQPGTVQALPEGGCIFIEEGNDLRQLSVNAH